MNVIPVVDLLDGQVVHGIAGRRESYKAIRSRLTATAHPEDICHAFQQRFGFTDLYVADLNAIARQPANAVAIERLLDAHVNIWLDAGTATLRRLQVIANQIPLDRIDSVIVGLECCPSRGHLQELFETLGSERAIFSLDLSSGVPLIPAVAADEKGWESVSATEIAKQAAEIGFRKMVVLDLDAVGSGRGVETLQLCSALAAEIDEMELTSGGGVRGIDDLRALAAAGCANALVASALHDGRITAESLQSL